MNKIRLIVSVIATFFLLNLTLIGQSKVDIVQPYSNTFLSIDYYNIGQSFTAEIDCSDYANIYAWVGVGSTYGSGDVGLTLKLDDTVLASGTSSVASDGMVTLDVSGANFTTGTSYDFYLTNNSRFAKVYWENYGSIGDAYAGGQLITSLGYANVSGYPSNYDNRSLSEFDLAFSVSTVSAVPIPGAVWLLGSGLIGLVGFRKKKVKK